MNILLRIIMASVCMAVAASASAQADEQRPVKVIVGFPAGGPPDLVARKIAGQLAVQLKRPVTVENRPGASGTIAAAAVAHAAPDGNTLLFGVAANLAVAPAMMRTPPYDPTRDFTPVIEVARGPYVLLVRSDAPAADFAQLAAWARSRPDRLNYATPGIGSVHHLAMEMLASTGDMALVHVPYRSSLYPPLVAGDVQVIFESLPGPLPFLESGKLRALAVTGAKRLARLPDVPTLAQAGVSGFENVSSWWGFVGPAGMPRAVTDALNAEIRAAMQAPDLLATMASWGIALTPGTPQEFARHIAAEGRRWEAQVKRLALPLQ